MHKKSIFTILGVMLAVIVASLSLVFAVGPRVSADSEVVLNLESHFTINGSHQLTGISDAGKSLINGKKFRVVIPSSVTSIGGWAFSSCSNLTSIKIPSSVTSIGYNAFDYCSGLTSIEIPSSVTSIGVHAFWGCSGLTTVTFAGNSQLTSIGDNAFSYCRGLTSIEIPSGVTSIGNYAFEGCSGLTHIRCEASEKPDGWNDNWLGDCNPKIVEYGYVAPQDTNNQETSNTVTENNKFNPLMAWVGCGIAAGLSVICGVAIVVAKKRRK